MGPIHRHATPETLPKADCSFHLRVQLLRTSSFRCFIHGVANVGRATFDPLDRLCDRLEDNSPGPPERIRKPGPEITQNIERTKRRLFAELRVRNMLGQQADWKLNTTSVARASGSSVTWQGSIWMPLTIG
jgi:hypothetical protein